MEKPVEEPSPESALRRRIAFVTQASTCLSEDREEEGGAKEVGSLEEAVALARSRLGSAHSPTPSPQLHYDTEEEGYTDAMPPYGDLIESEKAGEGSAPAPAAAQAPVSLAV